GDRLRGELATAVTGRLVDRDEAVVEVVSVLLQAVQAAPHRVVVPLRDGVGAGTTATGGRIAAAARASVAVEASRRRTTSLTTGRRAGRVRAAVRRHLGHLPTIADEHGRTTVGVLTLEEAGRGVVDLGQLRLGLGGLGPSHGLLQRRYGDDR